MSLGMNATTGRTVTDLDHLRQSITQILGTPIGTRVERRPFGSMLPELIDGPQNDYMRIQLYAATATALATYEPRLKLTRVQLAIDPAAPADCTLDIDGTAYLEGRARAVSLSVPAYQGSAA